MFLSMHNWMRAEQIGVTIRRLAQCGYDTIAIEGEPEKYDTKEVRNLLKENGIVCFGSVSLMFEGRDLIHADEAVHINIEGAELFQAILNTGDKLVAFHVADNNRMAPGMGDYDWVRLITTLKAAGYNDALTVEFVAPLDRTPANPYKNAQAEAEAELNEDQLKFIEDHGSGVLSDEFYTWLVDESAKTLRNAINKARAQ